MAGRSNFRAEVKGKVERIDKKTITKGFTLNEKVHISKRIYALANPEL
jgi:hypothetical protein